MPSNTNLINYFKLCGCNATGLYETMFFKLFIYKQDDMTNSEKLVHYFFKEKTYKTDFSKLVNYYDKYCFCFSVTLGFSGCLITMAD